MGRWDDMKAANGTGIKNYLTVGTYALALEVFKYRKEAKKEFLAIEVTVVEALASKTTLMRGKGDEKPRETKTKAAGERSSLVWNFASSDYPDSLWGEVKSVVCAIIGVSVAQMDDEEAAHAELVEAGKVKKKAPSPFDLVMDSLVKNDGEDFQGRTFKATIAKQTARLGHHYTKGAYEPYENDGENRGDAIDVEDVVETKARKKAEKKAEKKARKAAAQN